MVTQSRLEDMKRLLMIALGIWLGCQEFGGFLGQFMPTNREYDGWLRHLADCNARATGNAYRGRGCGSRVRSTLVGVRLVRFPHAGIESQQPGTRVNE